MSLLRSRHMQDALRLFLEDATEEARELYPGPAGKPSYEGASRGIAECRALLAGPTILVPELSRLLGRASKATETALCQADYEVRHAAAREAEIERFSSLVSAVLLVSGQRPAVRVTGAAMAALGNLFGGIGHLFDACGSESGTTDAI